MVDDAAEVLERSRGRGFEGHNDDEGGKLRQRCCGGCVKSEMTTVAIYYAMSVTLISARTSSIRKQNFEVEFMGAQKIEDKYYPKIRVVLSGLLVQNMGGKLTGPKTGQGWTLCVSPHQP